MAKQTIISGADYSAGELGYFGKSWPELSALRWAGFFGNGWPSPDSHDYSGRLRRTTPHGVISRSAGFATPSVSAWYSVPHVDTDVLAANLTDEITLCGIAKFLDNGQNAVILSSYNTSVTYGLKLHIFNSGTMQAFLYGESDNDSVNLGAGSSEGDWEFFAASYSASQIVTYRKGAADGSMLTASGAVSNVTLTGGDRSFRVGRDYNTTAHGGGQIASCAIYDRVLSSGEIDLVYAGVKSFMAGYSIAI